MSDIHSPSESEFKLKGMGVSPGIAFGKIHVNARGFSAPEIYELEASEVPAEKERFLKAIEETKQQIKSISEQVGEFSGDEESQIFEAHLLVLEDSTLIKRVDRLIDERHQNAEHCFYAVAQSYMEAMRRIEDEYFRERAKDIEDITQRVLKNLSTETPESSLPDEEHILVSYDLTPSDTVSMDRRHLLGFATENGSYTSHTAILARSLGIPAVVGIENAIMSVRGLMPCILDGTSGELILNPSTETVQIYKQIHRKQEQLRARLKLQSDEDAVTVDGREVVLSANVEFEHEIEQVSTSGAMGIGLFRTEFYLLENFDIPDEENQAALYKKVVQTVSPNLAIFRTLDSGGDKMTGEPLSEPEPNPFLGWRGIRFSIDRPNIFKTQIRALLRATEFGRVGIMFPMISQMKEIRFAKKMIEECRDELLEEGYNISSDYQVGAMIEVPSAAILSVELAKEVDFFSIGTNDLVQYTTAVDRVNTRVAKLYRPADPAVLRLIQQTVVGASMSGIWTGLCGEMGGDLELLPLLVGLGIDEISVGIHKVPLVKSALRKLSYTECAAMVDQALSMDTAREIQAASSDIARRSYPELLKGSMEEVI